MKNLFERTPDNLSWNLIVPQNTLCVLCCIMFLICRYSPPFVNSMIFYVAIIICYTQGYFCDETHQDATPESLSEKEASRNSVPEPLFPGMGFTRSGGMSYYPTTLPSNKLAYFVRFLTEFWVPVRSWSYFFRKIALIIRIILQLYALFNINACVLHLCPICCNNFLLESLIVHFNIEAASFVYHVPRV